MTFPIYRKDKTWYKSFLEVPDQKPDETRYVEFNEFTGQDVTFDPSIDSLLNYADKGLGFFGMHGWNHKFSWN